MSKPHLGVNAKIQFLVYYLEGWLIDSRLAAGRSPGALSSWSHQGEFGQKVFCSGIAIDIRFNGIKLVYSSMG